MPTGMQHRCLRGRIHYAMHLFNSAQLRSPTKASTYAHRVLNMIWSSCWATLKVLKSLPPIDRASLLQTCVHIAPIAFPRTLQSSRSQPSGSCMKTPLMTATHAKPQPALLLVSLLGSLSKFWIVALEPKARTPGRFAKEPKTILCRRLNTTNQELTFS